MAASSTPRPGRRLSHIAIAALALVAVLWLTFFDSHSLVRRLLWHQEYAQLVQENDTLRREIEMLETQLEAPVSDEVIEQIAREQYGMRRPGETVYRVEEEE
jgi:cell division protein FtsB